MAKFKARTGSASISASPGTTSDISLDAGAFGEDIEGIVIVAARVTGAVATGNDHLSISHGFSDGTNDKCVAFKSENGADPGNTEQYLSTSSCIVLIDATTSAVMCEGSFDSWLGSAGNRSGVRISWGTQPDEAIKIGITAFGGSDLSCHVGTAATGAGLDSSVDITGPGFKPDIILTGYAGVTSVNTIENGVLGSLGIVTRDTGDDTADCNNIAWQNQDAADPTNADRYLPSTGNDCATKLTTSLTVDKTIEITDMISTGFKLHLEVNSGKEVITYLAMAVGADVSFAQHLDVCPASTGTVTETWCGFEAGYLYNLSNTNNNHNVRTHSVGSIGWSDTTDEWAAGWSERNGRSAGAECHTRMDQKLITAISAVNETSDLVANWDSTNANGYVIDWTEIVSGRYHHFLAIEKVEGVTETLAGSATVSVTANAPALIVKPILAGSATVSVTAAGLDLEVKPILQGSATISVSAAGLDLEVKNILSASETVSITANAPALIVKPLLSGSATVSVTAAGLDLEVKPLLAGSATVSVTANAPALVVKALLQGSATVSVLSAGVDLEVKPILSGSETISITATAPVLHVTRGISGSETISITAAGLDLEVKPILAGTATVSVTANAPVLTIKSTKLLAGSATISVSAAGLDLEVMGKLSGSATVSVTANAPALIVKPLLSGSATVSVTAAGLDLEVKNILVPSAATVSVTAAGLDLEVKNILAGSETISITANAPVLKVGRKLAGSETVSVTAAGLDLEVKNILVPSAATVSITANRPDLVLSASIFLAGSATVSITAAGLDLEVFSKLAGSATLSLSGSAGLVVKQKLAGSAAISVLAAGVDLEVKNVLVPSTTTVSITANAPALVVKAKLSGSATLSISGSANLVGTFALAGSALISLTGSAPYIGRRKPLTGSGIMDFFGSQPNLRRTKRLAGSGIMDFFGSQPGLGLKKLFSGTELISISGTTDTLNFFKRFTGSATITITGLAVLTGTESSPQQAVHNAIRNRLNTATYRKLSHSNVTRYIAANGALVAPAQVVTNEVTRQPLRHAELNRTIGRQGAGVWTWKTYIGFHEYVLLEDKFKDLVENPIKNAQFRFVLIPKSVDIKHPPQHQAAAGTRAVITWDAHEWPN